MEKVKKSLIIILAITILFMNLGIDNFADNHNIDDGENDKDNKFRYVTVKTDEKTESKYISAAEANKKEAIYTIVSIAIDLVLLHAPAISFLPLAWKIGDYILYYHKEGHITSTSKYYTVFKENVHTGKRYVHRKYIMLEVEVESNDGTYSQTWTRKFITH